MSAEQGRATSLVGSKSSLSNKWYTEPIAPGYITCNVINSLDYCGRSEFQDIEVVNLAFYGNCLVLDGKLQSTEADEHAYHEPLVHPALLAHPNPVNVFIGGGGEGATLREVLKHKTVKKCVMVDIDGTVVDVCKKYLTGHHKGAFDDPRCELIIDDAKAYMENTNEKFDVMILDFADPLDAGPCYMLYTVSWYKLLLTRLNEGGIIVTQSGPSGILSCGDVFTPICNTIKNTFAHSLFYSTHIQTFSDCYGFAMGSNDTNVSSVLTPEEVDKRISERIDGEMRYLDGITFQNVSSLPLPVRRKLASETRIITEETPVFMPV